MVFNIGNVLVLGVKMNEFFVLFLRNDLNIYCGYQLNNLINIYLFYLPNCHRFFYMISTFWCITLHKGKAIHTSTCKNILD